MVNFRISPEEAAQIDLEVAAAAKAAGAKIKRATYARAALLNYARLRRMEAAVKELAADHPKLTALQALVP